MGRLMERLKRDFQPEVPAIPAIRSTAGDEKSQESQESQGFAAEIRARLLGIAEDAGIDTGLVLTLPDDEVAACAGHGNLTLRDYLRAQDARTALDQGIPPPAWGEPVAITCKGCGPVLLWHGCPDPVTACPWCFRRKAGKPIARPRERRVDRWAREDAELTEGPPYFRPKRGTP